jgi:flagellar hook assembly protein FlgD
LISFSVPNGDYVKLTIFDLLGRQVRELIATRLPAGIHQVTWDGKDDFGKDAASGIYLYKLQSENQSQIRRMTLIR